MNLLNEIRIVPDFPRAGIGFYDITTLLKNSKAFHEVINLLQGHFSAMPSDKIAGIEARGFAIASALAFVMDKGLILIRKPHKLPAAVIRQEYSLEYGVDAIEMHRDAVSAGEKVIIIDDLLATGGTVSAACSLIEQAGGMVAGIGFLIELDFLEGRKKLSGYSVVSLLHASHE